MTSGPLLLACSNNFSVRYWKKYFQLYNKLLGMLVMLSDYRKRIAKILLDHGGTITLPNLLGSLPL